MVTGHRSFRDISDIGLMMDVLVEGRGASPHSGYMHPGDLQWRAFGPHGFPLEEIIGIWELDGVVLGWALLSSAEGFDAQVRPGERGTGLEREIIGWAEAATLKWRSDQGLPLLCTTEAFVDDETRIEMLESRGYRPVGMSGVCFARALDALAEPDMPAGWEVRGLRDGDVDSRAACQFEAFAPGSKTTPETWRSLMANAPGYDADLDSVVVTPEGIVASAALAWLDEHNRVGEFEPVGTRPSFQRMGCGRAALLRGMRAMRDHGMTSAIVQTNATNAPAIALYESVGFTITNRLRTYALRPDQYS
jgi:ribosomal protein S18 acetylase RimI-like enzyme